MFNILPSLIKWENCSHWKKIQMEIGYFELMEIWLKKKTDFLEEIIIHWNVSMNSFKEEKKFEFDFFSNQHHLKS